LLQLHGITDAADADFTITSQASLIAANTSVDHTLTILLGGIAAISLIVGGIGVMNSMLVSVTERVREIGLRKALGGTQRALRRQFLVEASVLGLAGGVLGAGLRPVRAGGLPHPRHPRPDRRRDSPRPRIPRPPRPPRRPARSHRRAAQRMSNHEDVSSMI